MRPLAHGIGGRHDLPIPFSLAVGGAAFALVISFVVLGFAWRQSRLTGYRAGRPVPYQLQRVVDSATFGRGLRTLGLAAAVLVAVAAIFGPNAPANPTLGALYVLLWVAVPLVSVMAGPVWRQLNPLRTIHAALARLIRRPPAEGLWRLPARLGYWPAAASLVSFTWLELVEPDRAEIPVVGLYLLCYAVVHVSGAVMFGSGWFDRADGFEVYSTLLGHLSPLGRRQDGQLVIRNPLDGLDSLRPARGLVAVVCVLLGSTAYDGLSGTTDWRAFIQDSGLSPRLIGTLGLLGAIAIVSTAYALAASAAGRYAPADTVNMPRAFAHSIVPIAFGYALAHYYSLLVLEGQRTVILASDPLGSGANLFGTAHRQASAALITPTLVALLQVTAVLTGHVLGVVTAHDRAVRLFPHRHALAGQLPLLVLMVSYTIIGLSLLFAK